MEIQQIMEKLTPRQQKIIQLRADGYSYKDIAKELGISDRTVEVQLRRARIKCKGFIPKKSYITEGKMNFEYYLNQIEPELKKKAYVYWRDWQIKGISWEDLAQDLRIHLMNKFDLYDPKKSSFRTWANRVMLNKIKDIVKGKYISNDVLDQSNTLSTNELQAKRLDISSNGEIVKNN